MGGLARTRGAAPSCLWGVPCARQARQRCHAHQAPPPAPRPRSNAPNGKCVSPLAITAKSLATGVKANVTVTFTDACKRVRTAQFSYSTAGVTAVTPTGVRERASGAAALIHCSLRLGSHVCVCVRLPQLNGV